MNKITLEFLNKKNKNDNSFFKELFFESFPIDERRSLDNIFDLYDDKPHLVINIVKESEKTIGFLCHWELEEFVFGEYFAIDPKLRNGGYGKKAFDAFVAKIDKPMIIEVEHPTTELAARRIGFYERIGFKLWEELEYEQPPYHANSNPVPLILMSLGDIDVKKDFDEIKQTLYNTVYSGLVK